jgi:hypothetical protein
MQAPPPAAPDAPRVFGLGSAFGGGVAAAALLGGIGSAASTTGIIPVVYLPTLEFRYFLHPHNFSIDLSLPVTNIAIVSAALHGVYLEADAYLTFELGRDTVRFVAGPGLGFEVLHTSVSGGFAGGGGTVSVTGGAIRIPGQVGFEALTSGRHFGFMLLVRPFAEVVPAGGVAAFAGGASLVLDFMGYYTK